MRYGRLTLPLPDEHNAEQRRIFNTSLKAWRPFPPRGSGGEAT